MPNILTEKAGPLPLWGWLGIATAGALLFASKGKGSSSNKAAQQAAAQQALTAQQAALAATAAANSPNSSANTGSSTYGSGGSSYSGNGHTGRGGSMTPVYSATPAASTTAPVTTTSSSGGGSTAMTTSPSSTVTSAGNGIPGFYDPGTVGGATYYIPPAANANAAPGYNLENATQAYNSSGQLIELYQPAGSTQWQTNTPQPVT